MRQETLKIYSFDELSKEAKEKALSNFKRVKESLGDDMTGFDEYARDQIAEKGFYDIEIYYNLDYSQGSGLCFEGKIELKEFLKNNRLLTKFKRLLKMDFLKSPYISKESRYNHERSTSLKWELVYNDSFDKDEELLSKFEEVFKPIYIKICQELRDEGYRESEEALSEECLIEDMKANEYEFLENGERWAP